RLSRAEITPPDNPFAAAADTNERLVAALGLRNPFRFQIDAASGELVIGDVGENVREELDILLPAEVSSNASLPGNVPSGGVATLGSDFGWPYLEGSIPGGHRNECGPIPTRLAAPIFDYDRSLQNGAAVISAGIMRTTS